MTTTLSRTADPLLALMECAFREASDKPTALTVWLASVPTEELEGTRIWLGILGSRDGFSVDLKDEDGA